MADDRWLYKLLGIEEDGEDDNLREAGIPPALLFMRGLMRQGGGGGGDIKTKLAQVLGGAGNVATQVGRGARDLSQFAQQRAGAADTAFQQGLDPIGNIIASLPQVIGGIASNTSLFANPMAQQAFGQAVGDVGQAITGAPSFRVTPPPGLSAPTGARIASTTPRQAGPRSRPARSSFRAPTESPKPTKGSAPKGGGPFRGLPGGNRRY